MIYEFDGKVPQIDETAYVSESACIIGNVKIGPRCYIGPGAILRGDFGSIVVEEESAVEEGVIIHEGGKILESVIGRRVTIGHGAIIHSHYIAPNACIGMGAVLSLYSEIGEYTIVAEGAVVKQGQCLPGRIVAGGAPAKELRPVGEKDIKIWDGTKDWYVRLVSKYLEAGMLKRLDG